MKNLALFEHGASIEHVTSEYDRNSKATNLLKRSSTRIWFSNNQCLLPQEVIIKLQDVTRIQRVGLFLHGVNNQNPKQIKICGSYENDDYFDLVPMTELEYRSGDFFFDLPLSKMARYIKICILENYGGSGVHLSKVYIFGTIVEHRMVDDDEKENEPQLKRSRTPFGQSLKNPQPIKKHCHRSSLPLGLLNRPSLAYQRHSFGWNDEGWKL
mmetsp:Transcript_8579/g.12650  ORF Transcript_8579/g.12650 Transcript_8579/m.12650 type:complete len:212 (+) Transcript_8579:32-667(+)